MSLLEHEAQTLQVFKSNVEDLALGELSRLQEEHAVLSEALASVNENIKAVKAILRAASGQSNAGPAPKKKKVQVPFSMSEEREGELIRWLTGNEEEISSSKLRAKFPQWSGSYCNMALKHLRETGVLRLSATSGQMNVYRSLL